VPCFRVRLGISANTGATEEYVVGKVFVGGKPF
jgi:hypothetical protein